MIIKKKLILNQSAEDFFYFTLRKKQKEECIKNAMISRLIQYIETNKETIKNNMDIKPEIVRDPITKKKSLKYSLGFVFGDLNQSEAWQNLNWQTEENN